MRSRRLCVEAPTAAPAVCAASRSSSTKQNCSLVGFMHNGNYPCGVIDHLYTEVLLR